MKHDHSELKMSGRFSAWSLFMAWLLLIAIPGIAFLWSFELLLEKGEEVVRQRTVLDMFSELKDFREDLKAEALLQARFSEAADKLGFYKVKSKTQDLEKLKHGFDALNLRQQLQGLTGTKILAVFAHGPDTASVTYDVDADYTGRMVVSQTMLKYFLAIVNKQHEKYSINGTAPKKMSESAFAAMKTRSEAFIRNLLRFPGMLELESDKFTAALSGREDLGRFFFYYLSREIVSGKKTANQGGFIALVRQRDISVRDVVNFARKNVQRQQFSRSLIPHRFKRLIDFNSFLRSASGIVYAEDELRVTGVPNDNFLVRLACKDTYYPFAVDELMQRFPMLQISVGKTGFAHPVRSYSQSLKRGYLIFALVTAVLALRVFLFGFQFPLRIRGKILAAVLMASMLPVGALFLVSAYNNSLNDDLQRFEMINHLKQSVSRFNFLVSSYRTQLESDAIKLAEELSKMDSQQQIPFIRNWKTSQPLTHVFCRWHGRDQIIGDAALPESSLENQMSDILFTTVENSVSLRSGSNYSEDDSTGVYAFKVKGIGKFMSEPGSIHNLNFGRGAVLYSLLPVFSEDDGNEALDLILLPRYTSQKILEKFFKDEPEFLNTEINRGFSVDSCFVPLDMPDRLPEESRFIISDKRVIPAIKRKVSDLLLYKSQTTWTEKTAEGNLRIVHADFSPGLQCLVFFVAEQKSAMTAGFLPSSSVIAAFLLALIFFIFVFLGRVFIEPVRILQQSVEEVAAGNYIQKLQIRTGDEFDQLFSTYNEMLAGLNEKEKLASYVSEDVLAEVALDKDVLVPGGERAQVSVVFCTIVGLKKLDALRDSQTIFSQLGQLIDIADNISRSNFGVIDKIIEDTIMMVFRQSDAGSSHILAACKAALEISQAFAEAGTDLRTGAGIASGTAVSGKIGSKFGKLDYTVIGNPVNLAARLKAQTHLADQTGIIICPQTIRALRGAGKLRFIDRVAIKGRSRTFPLYELLSLRS